MCNILKIRRCISSGPLALKGVSRMSSDSNLTDFEVFELRRRLSGIMLRMNKKGSNKKEGGKLPQAL